MLYVGKRLSFLRAFDVVSCLGVDGDKIALIDEEGNLDGDSGLEDRILERSL